MESTDSRIKLDILREEISQCNLCGLEQTPEQPGGFREPEVFVVSDTIYEGRYKYLLDKIFPRVYVTYPVKCKTNKSRHLKQCKSWLLKEIELIQPKLIVLMGKKSMKQFGITEVNQISYYNGRKVISLYSLSHISMRKDALMEAKQTIELC